MDYADNGKGLMVPNGLVKTKGVWHGYHVRDGKVIDEWEDTNITTNQGLNHMLNVEFASTTPITSWYCGIFSGNYVPLATDTGANIVANATEATGYTSATRPAWVNAGASSQAISNAASLATFTFNATLSIYGAFLISTATKSDTAGTLYAAAQFSTVKNVVSSDQLLLNYQVSLTSS